VLEFFRPERRLTRAAHWLYNRHVLPAVGGMISGDREAYRYMVRSIEGFLSVAEFAALLAQAGFSDIAHRDLTLGIASLVTAKVPAEQGGGR
jgi:ubiquinone/menaquinone biosynthesis C-methylase UbiE